MWLYIDVYTYMYTYVPMYAYTCICVCVQAHEFGEAEKSHILKSASWRLRITYGIVPMQVQKPESQENQWCKLHSDSEIKGMR